MKGPGPVARAQRQLDPVYTAEPGTEDADRLALAVVLGTQELVD